VSGSATLRYESNEYALEKDSMSFVPLSAEFKIIADTDITFVINYFNKSIDFCEKLNLENLSPFVENKEHNPTLRIVPALNQFLSFLIFCINEGVFCKHFHEIKHKELFFILRFFYTKKELANLFSPIISNNLNFKSVVLGNYLKVNSIKELAQICNHSTSTFNRLFKKNFNESPYTWLQNQKLKYITGKLSDRNIPLAQITDEFGFSSPGHFTIFCKKHLNMTPSQYRNQHLKCNM
jgi:AraC-like DNA-binding protein